jgi:hypothetical protein
MDEPKQYKIEEVEKKIEILEDYNDYKAAFNFYSELKNFLNESDLKFSEPSLYKRFYNSLMKLKFIALNYFDDWEDIGNLLANYLNQALELKNLDLWNKIETNLIAIRSLEERDEIKKELIKRLTESKETIIEKRDYLDKINLPSTTADWIKDFNINLGIQNTSAFDKTKYLTNSKNIMALKEGDRTKIKILLELYEKLKLSSKTPQGYEDDVPVAVNGVLYIFHRGQMEPLKDIYKYTKDIGSPPQTQTEKSVASLQAQKQTTQGIASKVIDEEIDNTKKIEDLQIMANKYKDNSLQKRAIEEEIMKLKS